MINQHVKLMRSSDGGYSSSVVTAFPAAASCFSSQVTAAAVSSEF
jgi:hypothetical protein